MSRDPSLLTPGCYIRWQKWETRMVAAGIPHILTCTARWLEEQMALYTMGRLPLATVNRFRTAAGLTLVADGENKPITWTLSSNHVIKPGQGITHARAFDFAIIKNGVATWDIKVSVNQNDIPDYKEAGQIGKDCGLVWGGDWSSPDYPHLEYTGG